MTTTTIILEARICTSADARCAVCGGPGHWILGRRLGMTETYLEGTEDWVCRNCALTIDRELVLFAYSPEELPKSDVRRFARDFFGVCPVCGQSGESLSIGRKNWFICHRHGLCWCIGENILSDWRDESEEQWRANYELLLRCREVEPLYRGPLLHERILSAFQHWWRNLLKGSPVDELPF